MNELFERIETAKHDNGELERLIADYLPFIKRIVNDAGTMGMEYDDRLSLAMLSFMSSVKQYAAERGGFLAFTAACIRNRLIDESRKQKKYSEKIIPLFSEEETQTSDKLMDKASVDAFTMDQERENLSLEIDAFSERLGEYNISFQELPRICPKQTKARRQCIELGRFAVNNDEIREKMLIHRRLAQSELALRFGLSEKTIEKHRKYIVTIILLLSGDYPHIRAFLPQYKEV